MKDKVDLYSNIRVICTLLVVVGHCTNLGLVDSNGYDIIAYTNSVQIVTEYIREIIYSFHILKSFEQRSTDIMILLLLIRFLYA